MRLDGDKLHGEVERLSSSPEEWAKADPDMLQLVLFHQCVEGVLRMEPERFGPIFDVVNSRLSVEQRLEVEQSIGEGCTTGNLVSLCLLPFVRLDDSHQIIATASLNIALLTDPDGGDHFTGPKRLLALAVAMEDQERAGSIMGGLLSTGDRRIARLLFNAAIQALSVKGAVQLAHTGIGSAYSAVLDFYADWLEYLVDTQDEDPDGEVLTAVAAAMARAPQGVRPREVIDIERAFPVMSVEPGQEVRTLGSWSFDEYRQKLEQRLAPVIEREADPKVIPMVFETWP